MDSITDDFSGTSIFVQTVRDIFKIITQDLVISSALCFPLPNHRIELHISFIENHIVTTKTELVLNSTVTAVVFKLRQRNLFLKVVLLLACVPVITLRLSSDHHSLAGKDTIMSSRGSGRGEYYKNKYGNRGRGGGRGDRARGGRDGGERSHGGGGRGGGRYGGGRPHGGGRHYNHSGGRGRDNIDSHRRKSGGTYAELKNILREIDGRQYPSYHDLETPPEKGWDNADGGFELFIGRAQSDSFAPPTRCRIVVKSTVAQFPKELYSNKVRLIATADYLLRSLHSNCKKMGADENLSGEEKSWSGPKGGDIQVMEPCQSVLEQSAVSIDSSTGDIVAQITISLPARGRTILGIAADQILDKTLLSLVQQSLHFSAHDSNKLLQHVDSVEDQLWLQNQLDSKGLVAFVKNGAILPRASGADDSPMDKETAVPFASPKNMEVSFTLPKLKKTISGMGIPKGITLICGGGFHGKSTLLQTLQVGVYLKVPGDGRDFCVTSKNAFKVRAEDGRCVSSVDISPFIKNLPFGKDTTCFTTVDASGSTSQASNIVESVEMGADTLLIDEDTCATNFMIRDDKMMQLVASNKEPITPFVRLVRSLYEEKGISSILVIGGTGDYFDVADKVLVMDSYKCEDSTDLAKKIVQSYVSNNHKSTDSVSFGKIKDRYPICNSFHSDGKVKVLSDKTVAYGEVELNLLGLEQIISRSQTNAITASLQRFALQCPPSDATLFDVLSSLVQSIETSGLESLAPGQYNGTFAKPRLLEISGAVNRLRRREAIIQKLTL